MNSLSGPSSGSACQNICSACHEEFNENLTQDLENRPQQIFHCNERILNAGKPVSGLWRQLTS